MRSIVSVCTFSENVKYMGRTPENGERVGKRTLTPWTITKTPYNNVDNVRNTTTRTTTTRRKYKNKYKKKTETGVSKSLQVYLVILV